MKTWRLPGAPSVARPVVIGGVVVALVQAGSMFAEDWLRSVGAPDAADSVDLGRGVVTLFFVALFIGAHLRNKPPALGAEASDPTGAEEMRENARWFIGIRWLAALSSQLAIFFVAGPPALLPAQSFPALQACTLVLVGFNVAFVLTLPGARRLEAHLSTQAVVDLVLLTLMLHFSGGIENPLYPIYLFHVVLAAALLPPGHAYGVTFVASLLLLALGLGEGFGLVERYPISLGYHRAPMRVGTATLAPAGMVARLGSALLLFWVTAYFAVALRARTREHELGLLRATQAQRDLNRQLGLVVDSIGAALLLWTSPHTVSWCNHIALADHTCADPDHAGCGTDCLARSLVPAVFASGEDREEERVVHRRDGSSVRLQARAVALRGDKGEVEMVLLIVRDVTALRAMEMEVLHATRMAALGRVAAGMAHEIGNPLAAMNVRLALLRQDPSPDFVRESATLLQQNLERIHRLVLSVRRFGRPPVVERRACSIEDAAQEVLRMLHLDPRARKVEILAEIGPDLPPVDAVRDHLVQILVNLCINALESMPQGGRLQLRADLNGGHVRVSVADSGSGIPEAVRADLFRPFFTTKEEGSGLGLFLSKRFVCEMGGTIDVGDTPGGGATFTVRLPPRGAREGDSTQRISA